MGSEPDIAIENFEVFADGLDHPEGLAFDADQNLWAGGELGQVYRIDAAGRATEVTRLGGFCLGLTFSKNQDLWICNHELSALQQIDRSGKLLRSLDRAGETKLRIPNFSVFDSEGNLYFSDSGNFGESTGCVFRLRASGKAEFFSGPFAFPNGLALSADERSLFVAQSRADDVVEVPILPDGRPGDATIFVSGLDRSPDGLVFDADGNLYVTCYATHRIYRISPQREVSLFAFDSMGIMLACPTNAAFGSANFDELYVANLGRRHICRAKVGVRGMPRVW